MIKRVVLIDQEVAFRQLLRRYLEETLGRLRIVGEAGMGKGALSLCKTQAADLLILDPNLPDVLGAEIVVAVRRDLPMVRIVAMGGAAGRGVAAAAEAGAHGCVLKSEPLDSLEAAINGVAVGSTYRSPKATEMLHRTSAILTVRQRQLLGLIAAGCSTKEAAAKLDISFKTADHHRAALMKRLNVHDLASLVRVAMGAGFRSFRETLIRRPF